MSWKPSGLSRAQAERLSMHFEPCRGGLDIMRCSVTIQTVLDAGPLASDEFHMLVSVFEDALRELQLDDPKDSAARFIAQRLVSLAKQGERDPIRLRQGAVIGSFSD